MSAHEQTGPVEWRWVDIGGEQHKIRFDDLSAALSRGRLPPHVLVWRTGWTEWLTATKVPELVASLGSAASGSPSPAQVDAAAVSPPPPPLGHYTLTVPRGTLTLERPGVSSTPPPLRRGAGSPARQATTPGPVPVRDVMPTLADREGPARSNTLRPAGALPPPPRAVPPPKRPPFSSIPPVGTRPLVPPLAPPPRTPIPSAGPTPPAPPAAPGLSPVVRRAPSVPPPRTPAKPPAAPSSTPPLPVARIASSPEAAAPPAPPEASAPRAAEVSVPATAVEAKPESPRAFPPAAPRAPQPEVQEEAKERRREPKTGGLSRKTVTTLTSAGVLIPGALLLILALTHPRREAPRPAASVVAAPSARIAPPPPPGCVVEKTAQRIGDAAYLAVPALMAKAPDGTHLAVGFATSREHAVGIALDPATLDATPAFEQTVTGSSTLGVVPLVRSGTLEFAVDLADPKFGGARTVDAPARFAIGTTSEGLARKTGASTDLVWSRAAKSPAITTPRVASVQGVGHAVVFRQGGQDGSIFAGWLGEDGSKLSELGTVKTDATLVGTPTVSASDAVSLVAFAAKAAASDPWHVELATASGRALPEHSSPFSLPANGPGGEAISPASEALPGDRFLLQWTEGSAGNRAVRTQLLSRDLVAVGDPITLSTPDQNAGQGALFTDGQRVIALFLVQKETSHELWGASMKCH